MPVELFTRRVHVLAIGEADFTTVSALERQYLERIPIEHIAQTCRANDSLQLLSICSIRIRSSLATYHFLIGIRIRHLADLTEQILQIHPARDSQVSIY